MKFLKDRYLEFIKDTLVDGLYVGAAVFGGYLSKDYSGKMESVIHNYGSDVALPFMGYFIGKFSTALWDLNKYLYDPQNYFSAPRNAMFMFVGCSAFELAQYVGLWPGTYDAKDFIAYGVGAGLALGVDTLTLRNESLDELVRKMKGEK